VAEFKDARRPSLPHGTLGPEEFTVRSKRGLKRPSTTRIPLRIEIDPGNATVGDIKRFLRALSRVNHASGRGHLVFDVVPEGVKDTGE